uniref:Uncharacterized protein n=1 Tax=Glossina palpalis gambiensis TaxID=67801 RepID=A0A1B0C7L1_9MUSC
MSVVLIDLHVKNIKELKKLADDIWELCNFSKVNAYACQALLYETLKQLTLQVDSMQAQLNQIDFSPTVSGLDLVHVIEETPTDTTDATINSIVMPGKLLRNYPGLAKKSDYEEPVTHKTIHQLKLEVILPFSKSKALDSIKLKTAKTEFEILIIIQFFCRVNTTSGTQKGSR